MNLSLPAVSPAAITVELPSEIDVAPASDAASAPALDLDLLRATWEPMQALRSSAGRVFYENLFASAPELCALFPLNMMAQSTALMDTLDVAMSKLDALGELVPVLHEMGRRHVGYGVLPEHYPPVGAALLQTLAAGLGDAWTPAAAAAWTKVRGLVSVGSTIVTVLSVTSSAFPVASSARPTSCVQLYGIVADTMLAGASQAEAPAAVPVAEPPSAPEGGGAAPATAAAPAVCPMKRAGPPPRVLFPKHAVAQEPTAPPPPPSQPTTGACPYLHGSVDTNPYPGYVHGKNPAMCPNSCVPVIDARVGEDAKQTLLREAREFCDLYHAELKLGIAAATQRWAVIEESILTTGTYDLTLDELQHGARVAWRNAPKCSNRSKWAELTVWDYRHVKTNASMFKGILKMLGASIESGATTTSMAVFRSRLPGEKQGPRIWNGMLYRFAGYAGEGGSATGGVLGDPVDAAFTAMLTQRFGWEPPSPRSRWDVLPLLLQIDETRPPELFPIPSSFVPIVPIQHPRLRQLDALELRWFGVPVVSGLEISVGGLYFTAVPFAGWFADTEIVRDLTDEGRYNVLPSVAEALGLDRGDELWRDQALLAVNEAVFHSFRAANFAVVSKHTLVREFVPWYRKELRTRGYCPGNWKWIIPPLAASTSEAYLGLSKMTEYSLRPAVLPPRPAGWRNFKDQLPEEWQPAEGGGALTTAAQTRPGRGVALARLRAATFMTGMAMTTFKRTRPTLLIAYASVTGTATAGAERLAAALSSVFIVWTLDLANFQPAAAQRISETTLAVFVTSTYGSGVPPPDAKVFLEWAATIGAQPFLRGLPFAILGFGSRAFPRFAAAADVFANTLRSGGAFALLPPARVDALGGAEATISAFVAGFALTLRSCCLHGSPDDAAATPGPARRAVLPLTALAVLSRMASQLRSSSGSMLDAPPASFIAQLERRLAAVAAAATSGLVATQRRREWGYVRLDGLLENSIARAWGDGALSLHVSEVEVLGGGSSGGDAVDAASGGSRSVVRVSFDTSGVPGNATMFLPGDNIAVYPRHTDVAVQRAAAAFGWDNRLNETFILTPSSGSRGEAPPFPTPTSLRTALTLFLAHDARPGVADLAEIARYASGADAALLEGLLADPSGSRAEAWLSDETESSEATATGGGGGASGRRVTWVSLLERLATVRSGLPSPGELITLVPQQRPRYYSASSAPAWRAGRLDLTVAVNADGVCSSFLGRLQASDGAQLRVIRVPAFRLPLGLDVPVLAIAAGSGIAPLRAFWQERTLRVREAKAAAAARLASAQRFRDVAATGVPTGVPLSASAHEDDEVGPFVLLLGFRSRSEQLYAREVEAAAAEEGARISAHVAFSREPGVPKTYVQHLLAPGAAAAEPVRRLLAHPHATVFVCGDSRMAADVEAALRELVGGGESWAAVRAAGRYHEDVFGA